MKPCTTIPGIDLPTPLAPLSVPGCRLLRDASIGVRAVVEAGKAKLVVNRDRVEVVGEGEMPYETLAMLDSLLCSVKEPLGQLCIPPTVTGAPEKLKYILGCHAEKIVELRSPPHLQHHRGPYDIISTKNRLPKVTHNIANEKFFRFKKRFEDNVEMRTGLVGREMCCREDLTKLEVKKIGKIIRKEGAGRVEVLKTDLKNATRSVLLRKLGSLEREETHPRQKIAGNRGVWVLSKCLESEVLHRISIIDRENTRRAAFVKTCNRSWGDNKSHEIYRERAERVERMDFLQNTVKTHEKIAAKEDEARGKLKKIKRREFAGVEREESTRDDFKKIEKNERNCIETAEEKAFAFHDMLESLRTRVEQEFFSKVRKFSDDEKTARHQISQDVAVSLATLNTFHLQLQKVNNFFAIFRNYTATLANLRRSAGEIHIISHSDPTPTPSAATFYKGGLPVRIAPKHCVKITSDRPYLRQLHREAVGVEGDLREASEEAVKKSGLAEKICGDYNAHWEVPRPIGEYAQHQLNVTSWGFVLELQNPLKDEKVYVRDEEDEEDRGNIFSTTTTTSATSIIFEWRNENSTAAGFNDFIRKITYENPVGTGLKQQHHRDFRYEAKFGFGDVEGNPSVATSGVLKILIEESKVTIGVGKPGMMNLQHGAEWCEPARYVVFGEGCEGMRVVEVLRVDSIGGEKLIFIPGRDFTIDADGAVHHKNMGKIAKITTGEKIRMEIPPVTPHEYLGRLCSCVRYVVSSGKTIIGERKCRLDFFDGLGWSSCPIPVVVRYNGTTMSAATVFFPEENVTHHQFLPKNPTLDQLAVLPPPPPTALFPHVVVSSPPSTIYINGGSVLVTNSTPVSAYDSLVFCPSFRFGVLKGDGGVLIISHEGSPAGVVETEPLQFVSSRKKILSKKKKSKKLKIVDEGRKVLLGASSSAAASRHKVLRTRKIFLAVFFCVVMLKKTVVGSIKITFAEKTSLLAVQAVLKSIHFVNLASPEVLGCRLIDVTTTLGSPYAFHVENSVVFEKPVAKVENQQFFTHQVRVRVVPPGLYTTNAARSVRYVEGTPPVKLGSIDLHPDFMLGNEDVTIKVTLHSSDETDEIVLGEKELLLKHSEVEKSYASAGRKKTARKSVLETMKDEEPAKSQNTTRQLTKTDVNKKDDTNNSNIVNEVDETKEGVNVETSMKKDDGNDMNQLPTKDERTPPPPPPVKKKIILPKKDNIANLLETNIKLAKDAAERMKDRIIVMREGTGQIVGETSYVNKSMKQIIVTMRKGVGRKVVVALLRMLCFVCRSADPVGEKRQCVVTVTGSAVVTLPITIIVAGVDDVTKIHLGTSSLFYRPTENDAQNPFLIAPLDEAVLEDPDTHFFDGGSISVGLSSGGNIGDTFYLLDLEQQRKMLKMTGKNNNKKTICGKNPLLTRYLVKDPEKFTFTIDHGEKTLQLEDTGVTIASFTLQKARNSMGGLNLTVNFLGSKKPEKKKTIPLGLVTYVLNCIGYKNEKYSSNGGKAVESSFVVRVTDGVNVKEGKTRFSLSLNPPFVSLPGFESTVTTPFNDPLGVPMLPDLTVNTPPTTIFTQGYLSLHIETPFTPTTPRLSTALTLPPTTTLHGTHLRTPDHLVCYLPSLTPYYIKFEFTLECKCSHKMLTALLRGVRVVGEGHTGVGTAVLSASFDGTGRAVCCRVRINVVG